MLTWSLIERFSESFINKATNISHKWGGKESSKVWHIQINKLAQYSCTNSGKICVEMKTAMFCLCNIIMRQIVFLEPVLHRYFVKTLLVASLCVPYLEIQIFVLVHNTSEIIMINSSFVHHERLLRCRLHAILGKRRDQNWFYITRQTSIFESSRLGVWWKKETINRM